MGYPKRIPTASARISTTAAVMPLIDAHDVTKRPAAAWTAALKRGEPRSPQRLSVRSTPARCELVVVLADDADAELVEALVEALNKKGLAARREDAAVVVAGPGATLAREAAARKVLKRRRRDGKMEVFRDVGNPLRYAPDDEGRVFSRAEEAYLLESACCGVVAAASPPEGLPEAAAAVARDSLLEAYKHAGFVEDWCCTRNETKLSWWRAPSSKALQEAFGSEVALYFAWMYSFQAWLALPAVFGGLVYARRIRDGVSVDDDAWAPVGCRVHINESRRRRGGCRVHINESRRRRGRDSSAGQRARRPAVGPRQLLANARVRPSARGSFSPTRGRPSARGSFSPPRPEETG